MLKKYLRIFRIEFTRAKEYFLNFIGQIIYLPIQFLLIYFLWKYVYSNNQIIGDYTFYEMITYYFILIIVQAAIMPVGIISFEEWSDINEGKLNIYLSKPLFYPIYLFFTKVGYFFWNIILGIIFIYCTKLSLHSHLNIIITLDKLLLFIFSTFLGFIIMFNLFFIIGTLTFWVENVLTLRDNLWNVIKIFSGEIFPIAIFPKMLRDLCTVLPFQYIYYIPISIFQSKLSGQDLLNNLSAQTLWAMAMTIVSLFVWQKGVKKYSSQGG